MAGTPKTAAGPPEPDIVTQLQDQLALICSRFFNFIGALQRDAPPAPLHGEAVQDQRHQALEDQIVVMRKEITESLTSLKSLIQQLPATNSTDEDEEWRDMAAGETTNAAETAFLREELNAAKEKLDVMCRVHSELTDASLELGRERG